MQPTAPVNDAAKRPANSFAKPLPLAKHSHALYVGSTEHFLLAGVCPA
jgi:hypothetical protein